MAFHSGISKVYVVCAKAYDNMIINRERGRCRSMHSTYMKIYERLARDQYLTEILWLRVSKCLLRHNSMTLFCRSTVHCIFGVKYIYGCNAKQLVRRNGAKYFIMYFMCMFESVCGWLCTSPCSTFCKRDRDVCCTFGNASMISFHFLFSLI